MKKLTIYANGTKYERIPRCFGMGVQCASGSGTLFASNSNHGTMYLAKNEQPVAELPWFDGAFYRFKEAVDCVRLSAGLAQPVTLLLLEDPNEDLGDFRSLDYNYLRLAGSVVGPQTRGQPLICPPVVVAGEDGDGDIQVLPIVSPLFDAAKISSCVQIKPMDAVELFDSGEVAAGAAISSGVLSVARFASLYVLARNMSGATARYLNCHIVRADASEWTDYMGIAVGVGGHAPVSYSRGAYGSGIWTQPTVARRWSIAAAGADAARLTIWGMPA